MAETLYPVRQRCKKCGKGFPERGAILGLYDTYRCAGMAEPFTRPEDAPRPCVTDKGGTLQWKKRLRHLGELPRALKDDPSASTYWCTTSCGFLHIGHSRVEMEVEKTRQVRSLEEVGDALLKHRERLGLDRKAVAAKAGVRPIRLKELEEGNPAASWDALFKVLAHYRIKLALVLR